jgi:hypothetical protein
MYKIHKKTENDVWLMSEMTKELTQLKLVKSHAELGNFYAFTSIHAMPYQRKVMFDMVNQFQSIGIEKEQLIKENNEILKMLIERKQGYELEVYNKIATINNNAKSFWDFKKTSLMICALIIIPEKELEMIGIFNQENTEKNINEWAKDSDLLGFFLNIAQQKCNNLISKLNDLPSYMGQGQESESQKMQVQTKKENFLKKALKTLRL